MKKGMNWKTIGLVHTIVGWATRTDEVLRRSIFTLAHFFVIYYLNNYNFMIMHTNILSSFYFLWTSLSFSHLIVIPLDKLWNCLVKLRKISSFPQKKNTTSLPEMACGPFDIVWNSFEFLGGCAGTGGLLAMTHLSACDRWIGSLFCSDVAVKPACDDLVFSVFPVSVMV